MSYGCRWFSLAVWWFGFWVRAPRNGTGVSLLTDDPMFSERYGFRRPFLRIGKARFFRLGALD